MASKFDETVFATLEAHAPLDFETVTAIATEIGEKPKALVAAAIRAGIPYKRKEKVTKTGEPVTTKEDLVKTIAKATGLDVEKLEGLDKATKVALTALADAIG